MKVTLRHLLQVVAVILFLIQMKIAIEKYLSNPTVAKISHKKYQEVQPPTITICPADQYDHFASKNLGYRLRYDFLIGNVSAGYATWGGVRNISFNESRKLLFKANFDGVFADDDDDKILKLIEKFILPYGHCKQIENIKNLEKIYIHTNTTDLKIFVTDPAKSYYYRLSETSIEGDSLHLAPDLNFTIKHRLKYTLELEETHLDKDKEGEHCDDYGAGTYATYADCIEIKMRERFIPLLGCMPPWMSPTNQCQGIVEDHYGYENKTDMHHLITIMESANDYSFQHCPVPCIKTRIHSKFSSDIINIYGHSRIEIQFRSGVRVHSSVSSYDFMALIVEIGSSLGLWLGLSAVGLFDVIMASYQQVTSWIKEKKQQGTSGTGNTL